MTGPNLKEKFAQIDKLMDTEGLVEVERSGKPGGTENAICVVSVSSIGEIEVITIINKKDADDYYQEECQDSIAYDFNEVPGIYLIEFKIEGSGPDHNGEYDSWAVFVNVIKYKVSIVNKKDQFDKETYFKSFESKIYNDDPGSEFPRVLFIINDNGKGVILDILNEEVAYKSIIQEMIGYMNEMDLRIGVSPALEAMGLYTASFSIIGDMVNLFDRDLNEDIKIFDIKCLSLILEDEPIKIISREEKQKKEWDGFSKYVDELRMKEEHII